MTPRPSGSFQQAHHSTDRGGGGCCWDPEDWSLAQAGPGGRRGVRYLGVWGHEGDEHLLCGIPGPRPASAGKLHVPSGWGHILAVAKAQPSASGLDPFLRSCTCHVSSPPHPLVSGVHVSIPVVSVCYRDSESYSSLNTHSH